MKSTARRVTLFLVGFLLLLGGTPVATANVEVLKSAGAWVLRTIVSYHASQAIDWALGRSLERQLEERIPVLVSRMSEATGPQREQLREELELHNRQLEALWDVSERLRGHTNEKHGEQQVQIDDLRFEQQALNEDVEALTAQLDRLAGQVDALDQRVAQLDERMGSLEASLYSQCLDLRQAPFVGSDSYRIQENLDSVFSEQKADTNFSLSLKLHLNACTFEMTDRGLLIRVSMITRDLDRDLSLFVTFKQVQFGSLDPVYMNQLARLEYPLSRPIYRLDGQVREFFLPFAEIPFTRSSDRLAMAVVITHDGGPIYNSGDLVLQCIFSQRTNCRWR